MKLNLALWSSANQAWCKLCWRYEFDSHHHTCSTYALVVPMAHVMPELKAFKRHVRSLGEFYSLLFCLQSISPFEIANVWINPPAPLPPSLERVELIATASAKPLLMSYSHYTRDTHTHIHRHTEPRQPHTGVHEAHVKCPIKSKKLSFSSAAFDA